MSARQGLDFVGRSSKEKPFPRFFHFNGKNSKGLVRKAYDEALEVELRYISTKNEVI